MSLEKSFIFFLLYFPCFTLGAFSVYHMIIWSNRKTMASIGAGQLWERMAVFFLFALTFSAMLVSALCISDNELMLLWPGRLFYACIIVGIPALVLTTFVILFRCIESWSEACSGRKKVQYVFLIFLTAWLFSFLGQITIFIILIKQIALINID